MSDASNALIKEFLLESFENLSNISDELMAFEKEPSDHELLNSIYRKVHTLKGSASFIGFEELQAINHLSETLLNDLRDDKMKIDGTIADVLLASFDSCNKLLKDIEKDGKEGEHDFSEIKSQLDSIIKNDGKSRAHKDSVGGNTESRVLSKKKVIKKVKKVKKNQASNKQVSETKSVAPVEVKSVDKASKSGSEVHNATPSTPAVSQKAPGVHASITDSVVRVNVKLLDTIMNVVGELVLNRNQILQLANSKDWPSLNRLSQQLNVITTELQADIMKTRMQPVGTVINKFERVVRDLSRSQDKKIRLKITGQDTELDKALIEAIRDPMTHLIRNSVDHGIESPDKRIANGKNEEGIIEIKAYHEGGQVTIEINDDGNGISREIISNKAISKGIISESNVQAMSDKQILNLIFAPGFSTAEQVTNISGRGVGMDVVKSNIEKIGGSVDIESVYGQGSTFKLKIPLTLAIIPALVVQSCGECFSIPQVNLVELVRLENESTDNVIETLHQKEFFRLRGDLIPVFRLNEILRLQEVKMKDEKYMSAYYRANRIEVSRETEESISSINDYDIDCTNIVILSAEEQIFGLVVDSVLDTEEIVVKPLSKLLKGLSLFAGATIMGDGGVALIIDALGFYNKIEHGDRLKGDASLSPMNSILDTERVTDDDQEMLLCDLGDGRTYGIPLVLVNRLEEFDVKKIEWSGSLPLVRYGDGPMPLINLEDCLKLDGESVLKNTENNLVVSCVVVKIKGQFYGFVVKSILDIAMSDGVINSDTVDRDGLLGTVYINERTLTLIDIHGVLGMLKLGIHGDGSKRDSKAGKLILLVEDSPLYRKIESEFLIDQGFKVVTANDGAEGLDMLEQHNDIELVITDIEMPVLNGFEFCEKLRADERFKDLPVIAVSTKVRDVDYEKGKTVGFSSHLEKLNKDEVLEVINQYL